MNILSMLVRLQSTLGCSDLVHQMVLVPQVRSTEIHSDQEINLVVGYSSSSRSLTALDLTLWIAHQTRLATGKQVTVQVVYVINRPLSQRIPVFANVAGSRAREQRQPWGSQPLIAQEIEGNSQACATLEVLPIRLQPWLSDFQVDQGEEFDQADRILWQARCLADEWRGSLKTHLRFGSLAAELHSVVKAEAASLLVLGCESVDHPLVHQLGQNFPCPVLGIPPALYNT